MSEFDKWFNEYLINKTESCLDRDILRWAKPILEVAFDLQMLNRNQSYTLPFKGAKVYLDCQQENEKLKEIIELLLSMKTLDADNLYIKQDAMNQLEELKK